MGAHANNRPAEMLSYPEDPQFGKATPGKIAMWIFLVTDAMSFAGLLIAYAILRATKDWPNPIEALGGVDLPAFMTFLLICSSVTMVLSIDACRMKNREKMKKWLLLTIFGGVFFLGLQAYEYTILYMQNMQFGVPFVYKGATYHHFMSTFYSVTGFHGLHVLMGTLYLCQMYNLAHKGVFDNGNYNQLELAGLFWHFVDLVWILVFTFIYLL